MGCYSNVVKRGFVTSATNVIKKVTVIGGGLMGSGIAQVAAQAGQNVTLVDLNADILKKSEADIKHYVGRVSRKLYKNDAAAGKKFIEETVSRIKYSPDTQKSVEEADLVVEAIIENLEIKHKLFKSLDEAAPQNTIFGSNTSSLSISDIASVTNRKDRFGGLHFFNPVPIMKLLEVVRVPETTDETYNALIIWGKSIGKICLTCKDTPGFIVNRLLVPYVAEAARMLERGDATVGDIDTAMKLGAGHVLGPFEVADLAGIDTTSYVLEGWHKKYPDIELFKSVELMKKMVKERKWGRKTGEGFYKYSK